MNKDFFLTGLQIGAFGIKLVAAAAMVVAHLMMTHTHVMWGRHGYLFGAFMFLIMAFFLVEDFEKTNSRKKYSLCLFLLAVVSHFPYWFFHHSVQVFVSDDMMQTSIEWMSFFIIGNQGNLFALPIMVPQSSVIFTLFCAFAMLCAVEKARHMVLKVAIVLFFWVLSSGSEFGVFGSIGIFAIYLTKKDKRDAAGVVLMYLVAVLMSFAVDVVPRMADAGLSMALVVNPILMHISILLAIPLLAKYNRETPLRAKYFLCIFYPVHLLYIGVMQMMLYL